MEVSLDEAFREACAALGEALVRERLLQRRLAELERALAAAAPASRDDA